MDVETEIIKKVEEFAEYIKSLDVVDDGVIVLLPQWARAELERRSHENAAIVKFAQTSPVDAFRYYLVSTNALAVEALKRASTKTSAPNTDGGFVGEKFGYKLFERSGSFVLRTPDGNEYTYSSLTAAAAAVQKLRGKSTTVNGRTFWGVK